MLDNSFKNTSVSWQTMRHQDLIPAFAQFLKDVDAQKYNHINTEYFDDIIDKVQAEEEIEWYENLSWERRRISQARIDDELEYFFDTDSVTVDIEEIADLDGIPDNFAVWMDADFDWLLSDLFDALNDIAPDGCYFGAHPGNGSDYGFWEVEEDW
jgi:hypothetical protein